MTRYRELIEASKGIVEKATKGVLVTKGPSHKAGRPDESGDYAIQDLDGRIIAEFFRMTAHGRFEPADANAIYFIHARTALPALVQGLEDALRVVEAVRAMKKLGDADPDQDFERWTACKNARLEAFKALAHFDARERGGA